jgi:secreted trypsin-like serine protease
MLTRLVRSKRTLLVASVVSACAATAVGCSASDEPHGPRLGTGVAPIIGGANDAAHGAVAGIQAFGLQVFCSGTLVAPRTILSAGHCADAATSYASYSAVFGPDDSGPSIAITKQVVHPAYTAEGKPFDIAVFELASAPPGVSPLPFARRALPGLVGGTLLTHAGFGATMDGQLLGDGTKRVVTTPITRIDANFVYSGNAQKNTCNGDSGGPGIITGADGNDIVVSVVSSGPDCVSEGWDVRVDEVAAWVRTTALTWEPSFPDESNSPSADAGPNAPDAAPSSTTSAPSPSAAGQTSSGAVAGAAPDTPSASNGCAVTKARSTGSTAWIELAAAAAVVALRQRRRRSRKAH